MNCNVNIAVSTVYGILQSLMHGNDILRDNGIKEPQNE